MNFDPEASCFLNNWTLPRLAEHSKSRAHDAKKGWYPREADDEFVGSKSYVCPYSPNSVLNIWVFGGLPFSSCVFTDAAYLISVRESRQALRLCSGHHRVSYRQSKSMEQARLTLVGGFEARQFVWKWREKHGTNPKSNGLSWSIITFLI